MPTLTTTTNYISSTHQYSSTVPAGFDNSIAFIDYPFPKHGTSVHTAISSKKAASSLPYRVILEGVEQVVPNDTYSQFYISFGISSNTHTAVCTVPVNTNLTVSLTSITGAGFFLYDNGTTTSDVLDIIGDYSGSIVNIPLDSTVAMSIVFTNTTITEFWIGVYKIHTVSLPFGSNTCYPFIQVTRKPLIEVPPIQYIRV